MLVELFFLAANPAYVDIERAFFRAGVIVDNEAKGDDQILIAMFVGNNSIVITVEPGNRFFIPPGNLPEVAVNGTFASIMPVNIVTVGTVIAAVMSFPERSCSEIDN